MKNFLITESEKQRILEMHQSATSRQYLSEEKSKHLITENITDYNQLITAYPDLESKLKPLIVAANKKNETKVVMYGQKAFFNALKSAEFWTIYVYTFGPRTYGGIGNVSTTLSLDFPDGQMNEIPSFRYGPASTGAGSAKDTFYLYGNSAQNINLNGSLKLGPKTEIKGVDNIAAEVSKHFPGLDATQLVTIANNLKLGNYAKQQFKDKLTGVAKTVYDSLSTTAQPVKKP